MPLFRAADAKRKQLTAAGYRAHSMRQMIKRRLLDAGLPHHQSIAASRPRKNMMDSFLIAAGTQGVVTR
jgi:hypothetical protein